MLEYLILGFTQGFTEFLPISSSGHLYVLQWLWGVESTLQLEVIFHFASLIAIVWVMRKKIKEIIEGLVFVFFDSSGSTDCDRAAHPQKEKILQLHNNGILGVQVLVATILTIIIALIVKKFVLVDLSIQVVAWGLIITGVLVLVSHLKSKKSKKFLMIPMGIFVLVGLIQGIAVLPGISRSGVTIAALMILGAGRTQSTEVSFLLSIPIIFSAFIYSIKDLEALESILSLDLLMGFFVCVIVSYMSILFMLKYVQKYWIWFMPYCFIIGGGLLYLSKAMV